MHTSLLPVLSIVLATFVSEDLTVLGAGTLVGEGKLSLWAAFTGCFVGIFLGDVGLFLIGLLARLLLRKGTSKGSSQALLVRFLPQTKLESIRKRLERDGWKLMFLSRFLPGSRFVVYTGAGALGGRFVQMILVALFAGLLWTPLLLGASIFYGPLALRFFSYISGPGIPALILAILSLLLLHKLLFSLATRQGRRNWKRRLGRLRHPEFWPIWLFYLPLPFFLARLAIRHRSLTVFTAANPGIPAGGFIDESKAEILRHIPKDVLPAYFLIEAGPRQAEHILKKIRQNRWRYPIILKPDRSQKGIGLKLAKSGEDIIEYCNSNNKALIVQRYNPGPFEAGIFYYRFPGEKKGKLLSITNKVFPVVTGNGKDSLEELIWQHKRYYLQAPVFLKRFEKERARIPKKGEAIHLGTAGNHLQGCLFLRANDWITEELTERMDRISKKISKSMGGFCFGRFDVRYKSLADLKKGKNLCIIELNGATSESTDMYDPGLSILELYRTMWNTLSLLYKIGDANRKRGVEATSLAKLLRDLWNYRKNRMNELVSD